MKKKSTNKRMGKKTKVRITKYLPVSKMKKLVKRYGLSQTKVAKLCGISQSCVSFWFTQNANRRGVKNHYFEILAKKGYK